MLPVYVRLLRLYPASFRARFADEMVQTIRDCRAIEGRVRWAPVFADLVSSAAGQRWKENGMRTKLLVGAFVAVALCGTTMLVTGSGFGRVGVVTAFIALAAIGAIAIVASLIGRRDKGAEFTYQARRARWWWIPAGLAGGTEAFIGVGQLIDDPKMENAFALLIFGGFAALVFGGMLVGNRIAGNWMMATGVLPMVPFIWMVFPPLVGLVVIVMALADNIRIARQPRVVA